MLMKTVVAATVMLLFLALPASIVLAAQPLKVGVDANYPPFSDVDAAGRPFGLNIDMVGLICQGLGRGCEIVALPMPKLLEALHKKELDFVVASLAKTPEREKLVDFTECYYKSRSAFIGPASLGDLVITRENMVNRTMSAKYASIQYDYLKEHFAPEATLVDCGDVNGLIACLLDGRVEIVLVETLVAYNFLKSDQGRAFAFVGQPLKVEDPSSTACIAVAKGNDSLRQAINKALGRIKLDPAYDNLFIKYFGYSAQ